MYVALILLPLAAAIVAGFFGRVLGDRGSQFVTTGAVGLAALLSVVAFFDVAVYGNATTIELFTWIRSGGLDFAWALRIDALTAVMLIVVNGVSFMVHLYSIGYMSHDPHKPRFMAYLSLFTFAMLTLVTADNLVQMFFGWEGVGLASYLLIGFWYKKPSANKAAMKAFVVNRVGDFGFSLGIFGVFLVTGSVTFDAVFGELGNVAGTTIDFLGMSLPTIEVLGVLLFIGAMGKSAQLGLHTWLPDAMEGPTPVSALIHAATMVTAGVFMVARLSPLFELTVFTSDMITVIGASTAFFAATIGLTQTDIKRVIAYSTCSQLGYMFFAAGVGAYPAAIFHLMTHAFFKALLFLGAGSVIHAMSDEQDMRRMGGIWKLIPVTYMMMWIGSLALAGIPPFAGFFSKDMILETAYAAHSTVGAYAFWMGIAAAFMTAFYSWRLLFMTFHGKPRADKHTMEHVHESPLIMTVPLFLLAVGAITAGYIGQPMVDAGLAFWNGAITMLGEHNILEEAHHVPGWVKLLPLVMSAAGIGLAWLFYIRRPDLPGKVASDFSGLYKFLLNKWYFDELYDAIFVRPALWIGRVLWQGGDRRIIDGFGPDGIAAVSLGLARRAGRMQSGYVYHYAFAMLIGLALIVSYFFFGLEAGW
ncbi:NADH:ubiquinone oxidoreductase subunit L [Tistrella bauzanensis]|uniref:NADH:ubiquinone oxidoreductase subunit L n=1 Tax=Tistrella bauzanensis TaxID=657419 RepID=A0ABQ1IA77_9PROT|nr:NADH-quinone oxidoreductase subunit L [Tistrella bauzanensis]GGB26457.1 NADH:ubiquinone oxidoreductase subunit L [Tistrella bauzanensis]